jgi:hypothetical protein
MLLVNKILETFRSALRTGALIPGWFGDRALVGSYCANDQIILVELQRSAGVYRYYAFSFLADGVERLYIASQTSIAYCPPSWAGNIVPAVIFTALQNGKYLRSVTS